MFLYTKAVFGSCKSISGKYSIFRKCYFSERKMFSCVWLHFKKFSGKYFLVFGKEEGKDKPRKKNHQRSTLNWFRRRDASRAPVRRSRRWSRSRRRDRDRRRNIATARSRSSRDRDWRFARSWSTARFRDGVISIFVILRRHNLDLRDLTTARSRNVVRDLHRSRSWIAVVRLELGVRRWSSDWLELGLLLSRALFLSFSLSLFGNTLKWKWKCKMISVVKARFFRSTDFNFQKLEFSGPTKQPHFQKSISGSDFHPKQTHPNWLIVPLTIVPC